jgi:hypothetical protein
MLRRLVLPLLCLFCLAAGAAMTYAAPLDDNAPRYANQRYGFSLALPPGHWDAAESANGDGAVLRSPDWQTVEVRAYGTMGYVVQEKNFDAALKEMKGTFARVGHAEVEKPRGRFSLWGQNSEGADMFLSCFFGRQAANIVIVTARAEGAAMDFEHVVSEVRRSFKPGF